MNEQVLFLILLVASIACLIWGAWWILSDRSPIEDRLSPAGSPSGVAAPSASQDFSNLLQRVGRTVGKPLAPRTEAETSDLRRRLNYAGLYSRATMSAFVGARMLLLLAGILGVALLGLVIFRDQNPLLVLLFSVVGGLVGYLGPTFWLDWRTRRNQLKMEHALPDALDLLVVCVESGLTMDAAFQRVGREVALAHPTMARELATAHLETQMGVPRMEALRNIYRRTGSTAIQSLTAMLIQADRFGTSIADALRIYSESLRVKRRYKAEERAATAAVKISFPLVLFIFPALLIVIGGPALLRIKELPIFN